MKKALLTALVVIIVVVALILIIPLFGGLDHKKVSIEASQENFIDYALQYENFAKENSLSFEASAANVTAQGSYSQIYTLSSDNCKISVTVSNTGEYEIVEVSYGKHFDKDGSLKNISDGTINTVVSAYSLIGAAKITKDDVLNVISDAHESDGYYLYGYERIEKCGDYPTYVSYSSDNPKSEELKLSGITQKCKK